MKKAWLKKLRELCATTSIMELARKEVTKRWTYGNQEFFEHDTFLRCQVEKGILKVSLFLTSDLRLGSRKPRYQVFLDRKSKSFVTWDTLRETWRESKVDRLEWPGTHWIMRSYISPRDNQTLKKYLKVSEDGYRGVLEFQRAIRTEQLERKHKKETDAWDQYLSQIPELPEDWERWVDKQGIEENYVFYDYSRKKRQTGFCGWCEREVPIESPRHNKEGKCPACGHEIRFKARGRAGNFQTRKEYVYLLQDCQGGMALREFETWRSYKKGEYEVPKLLCREVRRVIYGEGLRPRTFFYGKYKQKTLRWIETANWERDFSGGYWEYYGRHYEGRVYGASMPEPECRGLLRTGLPQFLQRERRMDPEQYLYHLRKKPYLERLVKCGLFQLAGEVYKGKASLEVTEVSDFAKSLGIDRQRLKRLREHDGGIRYLTWLILEKRQGREIPDSVIDYFSRQEMEQKDLDFISGQMSVVRIRNYLEKQHGLSGRTPKELLSTWKDYLAMCARLGRDITKEIFFRPGDLVKSHDEAVRLCGSREIAVRAAEVVKNYPDVDRICQSIKKKYEFGDKDYQILVPERVEDIMCEGQALGHCANSSQVYYDRIQNQESYIMFLRKTKEPGKSYYTLEVEPDGTIRQKRTVGDRQNKDLEDAMPFLRKWQKELQRRLTAEDRRLAGESRGLRIREFEELRKKETKIWHGHLKGKLLADVLEADLLEAVGS